MEGKPAGMLLVDLKCAFDYVSRNRLFRKMDTMRVFGNLIEWRGFFMSEPSVSLVVDCYWCIAAEVMTGIPKRSTISAILFVIYLSEIFKEVEEDVKGWIAIWFTDNCGWLQTVDFVAKLYVSLEMAG